MWARPRTYFFASAALITLAGACGGPALVDGDDGSEPGTGGAAGGAPPPAATGGSPAVVRTGGAGNHQETGGDTSEGGSAGEGGAAGTGGAPPVPSTEDAYCTTDHWCWVKPLPHGNILYAMTSAHGHLWAVGEGGTIVHRSPEGQFDTVRFPAVHTLFAVDAVDEDDVWAVGQQGAVLHFADGHWSRVDAGTTAILRGVRAFATDNVWIGGADAPPSSNPRLFRSTGNGFTPVDTPIGVPFVNFIYGPTSNDWYVGGQGRPSAYMIRNLEGTWVYSNYDPTTPSVDLTAAAHFSGDVYASCNANDGRLGRFHDGTWSRIWLHQAEGITAQPIHGLAAADERLYLAGERHLLSYDGTTFRTEWNSGTAIGKHFVHESEGRVYFGGPGGRIFEWKGGEAELLYGMEWSSIRYAGDLHARSESDIWRFGQYPHHFDGESWSPAALPFPTTYAVVSQGSELYVTDGTTNVYGLEGSDWTLRGTTPYSPRRLWVSPTGRVFLVANNTLLSTPTLSETSEWTFHGSMFGELLAIDGTSDDDVWVVGLSGGVGHWNGETIEVRTSVLNANSALRAVRALSPTSVWIGGDYGRVYHWDGTSFTTHQLDPVTMIEDIDGNSDTNVFTVATLNGFDVQRTAIHHFDGIEWREEDAGVGTRRSAIVVPSEDTAWLSGPGALLRWKRP